MEQNIKISCVDGNYQLTELTPVPLQRCLDHRNETEEDFNNNSEVYFDERKGQWVAGVNKGVDNGVPSTQPSIDMGIHPSQSQQTQPDPISNDSYIPDQEFYEKFDHELYNLPKDNYIEKLLNLTNEDDNIITWYRKI